jgi:DNA helicase MCM8
MEQQQLSIAKAGVVASLPARCSIIAAANPETGKYNRNKTVGENLSISKPLLSRFDMIYILQDLANDEQDTHVAKSIIRNFRREESHSTDVHLSNRGPDSSSFDNFLLIDRLKWVNDTQRALPAHVIKDYISYAREYCKPKLTQDAADILKQYFMSLRYGFSMLSNVNLDACFMH